MKWVSLILCLCLLGFVGCVNTKMPGGKTEGYLNASWYGGKFHGRHTASGEVYDMYKMTAAHRSLPFGTWLKVTNPQNQQAVKVKVNDRGPFIKGRDLDLSYAAAKKLDILPQGVAQVLVENLGGEGGYEKTVKVAESPVAPTSMVSQANTVSIQVASFREAANAEHLKESLALTYSPVFIEESSEQGVYRVKVGRFSTREEAESTAQSLAQEGYGAWIVTGSQP